jgi:hypothetical protein
MIQKSDYDKFVMHELKNGNLLVKEDLVYGKAKRTGHRNQLGYVSRDGDVEISLLINGKTIRYPLCRVVWMSVNGKIPEGKIVSHIDNNKLYNKIDNLCLSDYKYRNWNPTHWNEEDTKWLQQNRMLKSLPQLAEHLNRSIKAVRHKIKALNMPPKREKWKEWTSDEDQKLLEIYQSNKGLSIQEISIILKRSVNSVRLRANRILGAYRSDKHLQKIFRSNNFYLSLKRTLTHRTSGSRCCLCKYSKYIDLHHIDGNRMNNDINNIASLCPNHHREVTEGEHDKDSLYCIWWRIYSDGSTSNIFVNHKKR